MKLDKKNTWYKYGGMAHIEFDDGTELSAVADPYDYPNWDEIPDGEIPGQDTKQLMEDWKETLKRAEMKFFDFGLDINQDIPK